MRTKLTLVALMAAILVAIGLLLSPQVGSAAGEPIVTLPNYAVDAWYGGREAPNTYLTAVLSGIGPGFDIANGRYPGYCLEDWLVSIDGPVHLYSSYDPAMPPDLKADSTGRPIPWDQINYVLNHKRGNQYEIEGAIWKLASNADPATNSFAQWAASGAIPYDLTIVNQMLDEAAANSGFVPGVGDIFVVILHVDGIKPTGNQDIIVELPVPAVLGDFVWEDINDNGIQDAGERGVPNVTVELFNAGDNALAATTTTDGEGFYQFTGLRPGSYYVRFTPPSGWVLSPRDQGTSESTDSDADGTGRTASVTLVSGQTNHDVDAGIYRKVDLCPPAGTTGLPSPCGALYWGVDQAGNVHVRYDQSRDLVDNSYGNGLVSWPRHRNFPDIVESDQAQFIFKDASGNVVLDFALDYLHAKAGTPSGYASLGPTGGDGAIYLGNAGYILDWNTSLARNLNDLGFCVNGDCSGGGTNLLVNSPPTVSSSSYDLPAGSPYAGWNFTNSYEVTVSGAAFGASGFGGVSVGTVHNSPPKVGTGAVNPRICEENPPSECTIASGAVTFNNRQLKWAITNAGSDPVTLSQVTLSWPAINGNLKRVRFDNDAVWTGDVPPPAQGNTTTLSDLTNDVTKKTVDPGQSRTLILEFDRRADADLSKYAGTLTFGPGCAVELP